jgi:hypothetical protein
MPWLKQNGTFLLADGKHYKAQSQKLPENEMTSHLYKTIYDRTQTQLAYKVRHFPWRELTDEAIQLIAFRHLELKSRAWIDSLLWNDTERCTLWFRKQNWDIYWLYNNVPTEMEWNKLEPDQPMLIDFRISPAIPNGGRAAILSVV